MGNFDGIHLGHQTVIRPILPTAAPPPTLGLGPVITPDSLAALQGYSDRCPRLLNDCGFHSTVSLGTPPLAGPIPSVLTFYPHPREFFSDQPRPWLTPLEEKAAFLKQMGVRQLILLPFNTELANLSPTAFVQAILLDRLQARHISVGADFRFGHQRQGNVALLQQLAEQRGVPVTVVDLATAAGDRISSSRIRQALCAGEPEPVQQLMGRPYRLLGRVVKGQQLGRQIGFPTANLQVPPEKFLPRTGVYSVRVYGIPHHPPETGWPGVMNLGVRPTVNGQRQSIEVHLLNWQGNLYGQTLTVALQGFLRPEQRFDSLDALKAQIQADCQTAQAWL